MATPVGWQELEEALKRIVERAQLLFNGRLIIGLEPMDPDLNLLPFYYIVERKVIPTFFGLFKLPEDRYVMMVHSELWGGATYGRKYVMAKIVDQTIAVIAEEELKAYAAAHGATGIEFGNRFVAVTTEPSTAT